jgi:hypothetical protein
MAGAAVSARVAAALRRRVRRTAGATTAHAWICPRRRAWRAGCAPRCTTPTSSTRGSDAVGRREETYYETWTTQSWLLILRQTGRSSAPPHRRAWRMDMRRLYHLVQRDYRQRSAHATHVAGPESRRTRKTPDRPLVAASAPPEAPGAAPAGRRPLAGAPRQKPPAPAARCTIRAASTRHAGAGNSSKNMLGSGLLTLYLSR